MVRKTTTGAGTTFVGGDISSAITPNSDDALSVGTAAKRFANGHFTTVNTGALTAPASTGVVFTSAVADSGSNVAFIMNSGALAGGSTALLSVRNNGTEHMWLSRAGAFRIMQSTGSVSAPFFGDGSGVARITCNTFQANDGTDYKGRAADGASAVNHKFGGTVALTNASAKIAAFYADAGTFTTIRASIDKDGVYENTTAGKGLILKSPDGTRYAVTVANGGTISITAA